MDVRKRLAEWHTGENEVSCANYSLGCPLCNKRKTNRPNYILGCLLSTEREESDSSGGKYNLSNVR